VKLRDVTQSHCLHWKGSLPLSASFYLSAAKHFRMSQRVETENTFEVSKFSPLSILDFPHVYCAMLCTVWF